VAVIGPSGRRLQSQALETNAKVLIDFLRTIVGTLRLCLEEGTHSRWLYEVLSPHVAELVVLGVGRSSGSKSDERDVFGLAEALRVHAIKTRVCKGLGEWERLRELTRAHAVAVSDSVRAQIRIKGLDRSRGISTAGKDVYRSSTREMWLDKRPDKVRPLARILYEELDAVQTRQQRAEKEMLDESQRHRISRVPETCPGLGPIRVAPLLPVVVMPYRFTNERAFWAYAGLAIVMRSSSDWVRTQDGR
jgi:transposase